jgi:SPP1 family predicted phage head-tail adaptor
MTQAGKRRHRVSFLEPVLTEEANGSSVEVFTERFSRWCSVEPIKGAEAMRANQPLAVMDTRIGLVYSAETATITEAWRASCAGVLYDLVSVVDVNTRHRDIEIMAKSGAIA